MNTARPPINSCGIPSAVSASVILCKTPTRSKSRPSNKMLTASPLSAASDRNCAKFSMNPYCTSVLLRLHYQYLLRVHLVEGHGQIAAIVVGLPLILIVLRWPLARFAGRQAREGMIQIAQIEGHAQGRPQAARVLLHAGGRAAHRHRPDVEILPDERQLAAHRMSDAQGLILAEIPPRNFRSLDLLAILHRAGQAPHQHLVVIREPIA